MGEEDKRYESLMEWCTSLLIRGHEYEVPFPPTSDKLVLANEMGSFFVEKIDAIHVKLDRLADFLHDSHLTMWKRYQLEHWTALSL